MSDGLKDKYDSFYRSRNPSNVYPVEFVVRAFLGTYPLLKADRKAWQGKTILDLGFGDGRNIPLLHDLGMRVCGVEISQEICGLAGDRLSAMGIDAILRVGRNDKIPFPDHYFDAVLACHACYYVDAGSCFSDNVREIARVLKPGGRLVFSAPIGTSYIFSGAKHIGGGHMEIADDPYGVRNGCILRKFDDETELRATLTPLFESFAIGSCRNDFWGIREHVWIVVCQRAGDN